MNITKEELAGMLHNAGLNAFSRPSDRSADSWNQYRLKIAGRLLKEIAVYNQEITTAPRP